MAREPVRAQIFDLRSDRPPIDEDMQKQAQGRRLAQARLAAKFATATEAAKWLGVSVPTYCAHENGGRQIRPDMANFYARMFKTTPEHLLYGARPASEQPGQEASRLELDTLAHARAGAPARAALVSTLDMARGPGLEAPVGASEAGFGLRLLAALGATLSPAGRVVALHPGAAAALLPPARLTDGFVPELTAPIGDPSERLVALEDKGGVELAVDGVFAVPLDQLEHFRLFAVKLCSNSLLPDLRGGQRVLVDPDDVDISRDGLFILLPSGSRLPIPALARKNSRGEVILQHSRRGEAKPVDPARAGESGVIGRVVMAFTALDDACVERMLSTFEN